MFTAGFLVLVCHMRVWPTGQSQPLSYKPLPCKGRRQQGHKLFQTLSDVIGSMYYLIDGCFSVCCLISNDFAKLFCASVEVVPSSSLRRRILHQSFLV
jgi:hypothetical protein